MILSVTPTLAVNITYTLNELTLRGTHHARQVQERAGGNGINIARLLRRLGYDVCAVGMAGGRHGELIRADLSHAGLRHEVLEIRGNSRRTIALVSDEDGEATMVHEPGPIISTREWETLCALVDNKLPDVSVMVLTGNVPLGAPIDGYAYLIRLAAREGVPTILDTSGEALRHGVAANPAVVKPNAEELSELTGMSDPLAGASILRERGAQSVVVSLGARGLLAITEDGSWRATPTQELHGNPAGAGDAVVAALAAGIDAKTAWPQRLSDAVALSTAAVSAGLAGEFDARRYQQQPEAMQLEEIHAPGSYR